MKNTSFSGFIGALSLATSIALGAYNAHGMQALVDQHLIQQKYIATFHTGVLYQFINSLGLMLMGLYALSSKMSGWAFRCVLSGMVIFCFSLYLLSFNEIIGSGFKILGAVTPLGGLLMIAGWLLFAFSIKSKKQA